MASFAERLKEALKVLAPLYVIPLSIFAVQNEYYRVLNKLIPGAHNLPALDVKNKVVVITGASSGLGKALAFELYRRGAKVILLARSTDRLKEICEDLQMTFPLNQNEPKYYYLDITEPEQGPWDEIPKIDILINNAGMSNRGSCAETSMDIHRKVMETNYFAHVEITNLLLPKLDPNGCIVVTSSVQGKVALPYRSSYGASKHALQGYFDSLRAEHKNLHVLVVSAGYINTGFGSRAIDPYGNPTGIEDANQKKGYAPEYCARRISDAIRDRKTDYIMAHTDARLAVFIRYLWPTLMNYILYIRGTKDQWAPKSKKN